MTDRIRGHRLLAIRADWFRRFPLCVHCQRRGITRLATQLDHIVALSNGGLDFDEDEEKNRQGLCDDCHDVKTRADLGWKPKARVDIAEDGWPVKRT
jgi:5-methylcytosine-specific restriction protein A